MEDKVGARLSILLSDGHLSGETLEAIVFHKLK